MLLPWVWWWPGVMAAVPQVARVQVTRKCFVVSWCSGYDRSSLFRLFSTAPVEAIEPGGIINTLHPGPQRTRSPPRWSAAHLGDLLIGAALSDVGEQLRRQAIPGVQEAVHFLLVGHRDANAFGECSNENVRLRE